MVRPLALLLLSAPAWAVPATLTHQGRLLDSTGQPIQGTVDVTFALFDAAASGNELWSETHSLDADNGFFSVQLGTVSSTPLDPELFDGVDAWLQISVGGTALPDRVAINSVPYAIRASSADVATDVRGGTVEADSLTVTGAITGQSLVINGNTVIDGSGFAADVAWSNLQGIPAELTDGDADTLATLSCDEGQVAAMGSGGWSCADDADTDTLATLSCDEGQVGKMVSGSWTCADDIDTDTFGTLSCADGQVLKWSGSAFACAADDTVDTSATIAFGGRVGIGDDGATCDSSAAGSLRVDTASNNALEYCDGTAWTRIAGGALGSNAGNAGTSCKDILDSGTATGDGIYWIDPKSTGAFEVYCDMTTDGGDWTRFWWFEAGNTMNVTDVLAGDLPDCDPRAGTCFSIMPITNPPELHVQNNENKWATWTFNGNNTSNAVLGAFTARAQTARTTGASRSAFNPSRQSAGFGDTPYRCDEHNNQNDNCDSFWYEPYGGVTTFYMDDDTGYGETAFGAGRTYNDNVLGVDSFEPASEPNRAQSLDRSLWLYYH